MIVSFEQMGKRTQGGKYHVQGHRFIDSRAG